MPELPEVETIVRGLQRDLPGVAIRSAKVLRPDLIEGGSAKDFERGIKGRTIHGVSRRAKNIVFDLGADRLIVNLGMTGRLLVVDAKAELPTHLGVTFRLSDKRLLLYHDVRRFGRLALLSAEEWADRERALGYEPLSRQFTAAALRNLAGKSRVGVKAWLMDQKRVVGVGNIYASEALYRAGIDPRRPALSITGDEASRLHSAIRKVLREAIEFRGTTLLDYRDSSGQPGGFAARLKVYDRKGEPCPTCGNPIQRTVLGGRSTFFCPNCQR